MWSLEVKDFLSFSNFLILLYEVLYVMDESIIYVDHHLLFEAITELYIKELEVYFIKILWNFLNNDEYDLD